MCEDRHHECEANERKQEADDQGRRDDQSPKRHRERVRERHSDSCANSHRAPTLRSRSKGNETTLILSTTTAKAKPNALPKMIKVHRRDAVRIAARNALDDFGVVGSKAPRKALGRCLRFSRW